MSPLAGEPPLLRKEIRFEAPEPSGGRLGLGWAALGRVKVERERSDRTLTRAGAAKRWSRRAAEADESASGEAGQRSGAAEGRRGKTPRSGEKTAAVERSMFRPPALQRIEPSG